MKGNSFVRFNPETWQEEPLLWNQNCKQTSTYEHWIAIFWTGSPMKIDIQARYWDIEDANGWVAILWSAREESLSRQTNLRKWECEHVRWSLLILQFWGHWKRSTEESRTLQSLFLADTPIILKCLTWEHCLWRVTEVFAEIWWQASAAVTWFLLHFNNAKQSCSFF